MREGTNPRLGRPRWLSCVTGAMRNRLCQSRCSGPPSGPAENLRCKQERETLRRAVMGKSSSAKDSITSSKAGGPLPPSAKLPCAEIARAQVKTFDATARACSYAGYGTKARLDSLQNLVL